MHEGADSAAGGPMQVRDGPFSGWLTWGHGADKYETAIGPFYFRQEGPRTRCAFTPRSEHLNNSGAIHGGALMSFADFALFAIAHAELQHTQAVTVSFASEFIRAGDLEAQVEAEGELLRATRSMIFLRGLVTQRGRTLLAFSGTLKKISAS